MVEYLKNFFLSFKDERALEEGVSEHQFLNGLILTAVVTVLLTFYGTYEALTGPYSPDLDWGEFFKTGLKESVYGLLAFAVFAGVLFGAVKLLKEETSIQEITNVIAYIALFGGILYVLGLLLHEVEIFVVLLGTLSVYFKYFYVMYFLSSVKRISGLALFVSLFGIALALRIAWYLLEFGLII